MKNPYDVIKTVRVTEKGTTQTEKANQYQVVVDKRANKVDIKYAVEQAFKVKVLRVNTMRVRGKPRRERTAQFGRTPAWKKAVVTLKAGDKIELT
jgi:large subunit ribosomal protein L23